MAPPTRMRPHLNDLLQKNHELEHAVADLRHQITQSSAKWADERKTLAMGCDALMTSFVKFRARLDGHPSDGGDSEEGEVEQNPSPDAGRQSEERSETANGALETTTEGDQRSSATEELDERCRALATELRSKEDALEESRKKCKATEEELQRVQQSLDDRSEQLRAVLASSKTDTDNRLSPEHTSDTSAQANPSKTGVEDTLEKLYLANQEIRRLKRLLQEWKTYAFNWKRVAQMPSGRESEPQLREQEPSAKQDQSAPGLSSSTQSLTPHADANGNNDSSASRIPTHCTGKEAEISVPQDGQLQNVTSEQTSASPLISVDSVLQKSGDSLDFNSTEFEVCIHTCNSSPCQNDSRSSLWPRKKSTLPRHTLSSKKHHQCTPECPGYRLLNMSLADAMKEPRLAKCRPPTEAELALAAEATRERSEPTEKGIKVEGEPSESSGESEPPGESDGGSTRSESRERERERSPQAISTRSAVLGKRPHTADTEEPRRFSLRIQRPRVHFTVKP